MVANRTELLLAIASVMREGSEAEKSAACGAICNVCAHGNTSSMFAECRPLVQAILDVSRGEGPTRLKAVGCFTNMSCGSRAREVRSLSIIALDSIFHANLSSWFCHLFFPLLLPSLLPDSRSILPGAARVRRHHGDAKGNHSSPGGGRATRSPPRASNNGPRKPHWVV